MRDWINIVEQPLNEGRAYEVEIGNGTTTSVILNPTVDQALMLITRSTREDGSWYLRGLCYRNSKLFVWDGWKMTHDQIREYLFSDIPNHSSDLTAFEFDIRGDLVLRQGDYDIYGVRSFQNIRKAITAIKANNLTEATLDRPWTRADLIAIEARAKERFDYMKNRFMLLGQITPQGNRYEVWGEVSDLDARFYACDDDNPVGYLTFKTTGLPNPKMMAVAMVFVLRKYQRQGIASDLYRFALSKGVEIVCDSTLTKGSRAIWQSMIDDPRISVSLIDYDPYNRAEQPIEKSLTNIRLAFSQKQRRMVARQR